MTRRKSIAAASLLSLLMSASVPFPAHASSNVLMIILDDVGVDMIGAYSSDEGSASVPSTPQIDSLAAQGIRFQNMWANPLCATTRATIQTGRYSYRTGMLGSGGTLSLNELTIAGVFNANSNLGYTQAVFGKWGLSGSEDEEGVKHPIRTGYDFFAGKLGSSIPEGYYGHHKSTAEYLPDPGNGCDPTVPAEHQDMACIDWIGPTPAVNYATTENRIDAVNWIDDVHTDRPWFAVLAFNASHRPFHAPPGDDWDDPNRLWETFDPSGYYSVSDPQRRCTTEEGKPICFRAAIEAADKEIARLLTSISPDGTVATLLADTTVIVLGDNGSAEGMAVPPFKPERAKFSLYEGGINVPFIIAGAGVATPNRVSEALVNTTDLFATALELAGVDLSGLAVDHDSFSLLPILSDDCSSGCGVDGIREYVYAEMWQNAGLHGKTIRDRLGYKLKYTYEEGEPGEDPESWELFYLGGDPNATVPEDRWESNNLLLPPEPYPDDPGNPEDDDWVVLTASVPELQPIVDDLFAKLGQAPDDPNIPAANDDVDADATANGSDNCVNVPNRHQADRNNDGQGDACTYTCDLDLNGAVNVADALLGFRLAVEGDGDPSMVVRADIAPATGGPTDNEVHSNDVMLLLRAASGQSLAVCNPSP